MDEHEQRAATAERFLALLRPIQRELEGLSRRLCWNEADTFDALQNAVLKAFKAFDRYHDDGCLRAWMFKIVTNEVRRLNQRQGRLARFECPTGPESFETLPACETTAIPWRDWLNAPEALADALDQELVVGLKTLTESERAVLLLRALGDFRYREIAEILEIPMGSVMGHLARARGKLQAVALRHRGRAVL